jgi:peptide chain release factor subunit 1
VPTLGSEKITRFYGCQLTTSNSTKQHKLQKLIAWLSDKQGRGKEFISLYVPSKAPIAEIVANVKKDTEAITLKSKTENDRFQDALKNVLKHLKLQKEAPENGLVLFAGAFTVNGLENGQLNIEELTPPQPITGYVCVIADHFYLDPLRDMLRDQRIVGLIALDSKQASFGVLNGGNLELIDELTSGVPGKTGKGGQSQRRYERERDMEVTYFFHRVAEHAAKEFMEKHPVTVLIVGGPGQTKEGFLKGDFLNYQLKNTLLKIIDTQSAGLDGVREMFEKSSEALMTMCGPEEKRTMERLLTELNKQNGLAICGLDPVLEGLKAGTVEVALLTDSPDLVEDVLTCKKCGLPKEQILNKKETALLQNMLSTPCAQCHGIEYEVVEKDMVDVLEDVAAQTNARVEVIFTESEEKAKLKALGGFAALLRYKPT